ncbi:MAG: hypothetical protein ACRYFS_16525 [Janthinobacterium lividum]
MNLTDYYPLFICIGVLLGSIVFLRAFFTLWGPIHSKVSGEGVLDVSKDIHISGLKDTLVNVRFKSGTQLLDVVLVGYVSTHHEAPYDFKQLLILRDKVGKQYFARVSEIEYFEQVVGMTPEG